MMNLQYYSKYGSGNGLSFSVSKDGVSAEKVFSKTSVVAGDM